MCLKRLKTKYAEKITKQLAAKMINQPREFEI